MSYSFLEPEWPAVCECKYDEALKLADNARKTNSNLPSADLARAQALLAKGDVRQAEIEIRNALSSDPTSLPALTLFLNLYARQGRTQEAIQRLVHSPENDYRKTLLCECVSAYLPTDGEQREQFENMLRNHPDQGVQAMEMGLLDHVEHRGMLKLIRRQLEERFGPLPPDALARLEVLPQDRLLELGSALLSAASLEELGLGTSPASDT